MSVSVGRAKPTTGVMPSAPLQPPRPQPARSDAAPAPVASAPAAPDPAARQRNIGRLRRIEGQLRGLQRMLEKDSPCADVLTQMASAHEALRAVARELLREYLKQRLGRGREGEALGNELVDLIQKYSR